MKKASGVLAGWGVKNPLSRETGGCEARRGAGREVWLTVAHAYHAGALWAGSFTIIESRLEVFAGLL